MISAHIRSGLALFGVFALAACTDKPADRTRDAQQFVQQFYDWYTPRASADTGQPAFRAALSRNPAIVDSSLAAALEADYEAQRKVQGEIVGLDGDPFLQDQDHCQRYSVLSVVAHGAGYRATIARVCDGKESGHQVFADVEERSARWLFVNFGATGIPDLRAVLEQLRKDREKNPQSEQSPP